MLLSVIIPTLNRSKFLSKLLDSMFAQESVFFAWEIIVVDNASTDETHEMVQEKILQAPVPLRYILEPKPGLHEARHKGTREAAGEIIAFLDDDTVLPHQWISGVELILAKQADAVVSRILPKWEISPPEWLVELIGDGTFGPLTLLDMGNAPKLIDPLFVWGASFFIRRSLVFDLRGFHPDGMPPELLRYRGDGEMGFFQKFKEKGYCAWYDPRSVAYHTVSQKRMTLEYLSQRSYSQGVSDSYSQIRKAQGLDVDQVFNFDGISLKRMEYLLQRTREMAFAEWLNWCISGFRRHIFPTRQENIRKYLKVAYHEGWQFHQAAVRADPELLAFVLKTNYLA